MNTLIYNRIHAPKQTVTDYLKQLSNEELASIYGTSFQYKIMLPDLLKKLKLELTRRQLTPQVMHS
jgi:bacteriocin-like protein